MKRIALIALLTFPALIAPADAGTWTEFAVSSSSESQERPDVDGTGIVWQQLVEGDWDVYFIDLDDVAPAASLTPYTSDQQSPAIHANQVVWEDKYIDPDTQIADWDIRATDVTDPAAPVETLVTPYLDNQQSPSIYGGIVVWQDDSAGDIDIYGTDIADVDNMFNIALYEADQQRPVIYDRRVIWQDNYLGDWDIWSADLRLPDEPVDKAVSISESNQEYPSIWGSIVAWQENINGDWQIWAADISNPDAPVEFPVVEAASLQTNPDVGDNLIVWQDYRNGKDWDIYGYNLTTHREFRITDDAADQTYPAVSGDLVVWQDNRGGQWNIYAAELSGAEVARCVERPTGDVNGDCIVNFVDLAQIAADWLVCGLDVPEACVD